MKYTLGPFLGYNNKKLINFDVFDITTFNVQTLNRQSSRDEFT